MSRHLKLKNKKESKSAINCRFAFFFSRLIKAKLV